MTHEALAARLATLPGAEVLQVEYAVKGYDLDVHLPTESLVPAVELLDAAGYFLETITGVDWLGEQAALRKEAQAAAAKAREAAKEQLERAEQAEQTERAGQAEAGVPPAASAAPLSEDGPLPEDSIEVVYDFNRFSARHRIVLRVRTPRSCPAVPTVQHIYPIAHWHEREAHDFFGIDFVGHPYLVPLLLPENADFHPLLKDYGA